jgi:hypothetical protein
VRRISVVVGLAAAFACAEGFAPGARVNLAIVPVFSEAAPGVLSGDLDGLHIRVTRVPSGDVVIDTTAAVDTAGGVDLPLTVPLLSDPESFEIVLEGVRSSDNAVLYTGIDTVRVFAGSATPPPIEIAISYVGPCRATSGCQVTVGPLGVSLVQGDSVLMTALVDSLGTPRVGVPVSLINLDTSLVRVRSSRYVVARSGTPGGQARIVGQIRSDEDTLALTILSVGSPAIGLLPTSVNFAATAGGASPAAQTVAVSNTSVGTLSGLATGTITYGTATGWLVAGLNTTTAPATLTLTATTGSLAAGTYTATVPVTSGVASNTPQNVSVTFVVAQAPAINLNPTTINFSATQGGASPLAQTVSVTNSGGGTLNGLSTSITYGVGSGWLAAGLNTTTAPATLTLTPALGSLTAGTYTATVTVSSTVGVASKTVAVSFVVNPGAPAAVIVTPGYAAIRTTAPNQAVQLADTVKDAFGNLLAPTLATWTSRSPAVATVNASTGLVTGVARGSAVIVAQAGTSADSIIVSVGNAATAPGDMLVAAVTNGRAFGVRRLGQPVTVDVRVDQLAVPADSLGSYNARYTWNPAMLRFDSTSAGTYTAPTVNTDSVSVGTLRFAAVNANSKSGPLVLTRIWFTALTTGADGHVLEITEMSGVSPNFYNYFANNRYVVVSGTAKIIP